MSDDAGSGWIVTAKPGWTSASCPWCGETIRAYEGKTIPDDKVQEWAKAHRERHRLEHRPYDPPWDGKA